VIDLGKLIADRQDQLRGRPRNWRDDFNDWRARIDWDGVILRLGVVVIGVGVLVSTMIVVAALLSP
jgi:hypothetical protein